MATSSRQEKFIHFLSVFLVIHIRDTEAVQGAGNVTDGDLKASARVLILGAGMAGISAAKALSDAGLDDFIIIEGSDKVGGRTKAETIGGYTMEVGSAWIEGTGRNLGDSDNPILDMARKYNISTAYSNYDDWVVRNSTGHNITDQADRLFEEFAQALQASKQKAYRMQTGSDADRHRPDTDVRSELRRLGWNAREPLHWVVEYFDLDFDTAREPELTSLKYFYDWSYHYFEGEDLVVTQQGEGGFSKIYTGLLGEILNEHDSEKKLYLNEFVTTVEIGEDGVIVTTTDGDKFKGDHAILTFSIGVLQSSVVTFIPPLPDWKLDSIYYFDMAVYTHFFLKFPSNSAPFWDDIEWIMYTSSRRGYLNMWQNMDKTFPGSHILQGTITGSEALQLEKLTDAEIQAESMAVLKQMYGDDIPEPEEILVPRWHADPLFFGSYINWPPGYPQWQQDALKAPLGGRLHFAGEATHQMFAYLHGAFYSGKEVAEGVVRYINDNDTPPDFVPPYEARGCTYEAANNYDRDAQADDSSCTFPPQPTSGSVPSYKGSLLISQRIGFCVCMGVFAWVNTIVQFQ